MLSNDARVVSLNKVVKAITDKEGGNLGEYIGVSALKDFINKDVVLGESYEFDVPGTQFRGRGITAESFISICQGYVTALQRGALTTDRQREIAISKYHLPPPIRFSLQGHRQPKPAMLRFASREEARLGSGLSH